MPHEKRKRTCTGERRVSLRVPEWNLSAGAPAGIDALAACAAVLMKPCTQPSLALRAYRVFPRLRMPACTAGDNRFTRRGTAAFTLRVRTENSEISARVELSRVIHRRRSQAFLATAALHHQILLHRHDFSPFHKKELSKN